MSHLFSSDQPISNSAEDKLGRSNFISIFANSISSWSWNESLVIGLQGKWGSGKTSVVNLVKEKLDSEIKFVSFSPWNWSDPEFLNNRFFSELLDAGDFSDDKKKVFLEYAQLLESVDKRLEIAIRLFRKTFVREENPAKGLDGVKQQVKKIIEESGKKFLVCIDDLDRLTPKEVLEVFKLVKCNADFSNIVYVLVYQRDAIIQHLGDVGFHNNPEKYLEKIIQIALDIPEIDQQRIHGILSEEVSVILAGLNINSEDKRRIAELFNYSMMGHVRNLRDLKRYVSLVKFSKAMHSVGNELEVNMVDLLALSVLKLFHSNVFERILHNRNMLLGQELGMDEEDRKYVSFKTGNLQEDLLSKYLLEFLFPDLELLSMGNEVNNYYSESAAAFHNKRVCHSSLFDRYFQMDIPDGDVRFSDLNKFVEDLVSKRNIIEKYGEDPNLEKMVLRIRYYLEKPIFPGDTTFIRNMLQIGDLLSNTRLDLTGSPFDHVCFSLKKRLSIDYSSDEDKASFLLSAFRKSHSFAVIARYLNSEWWSRQEDTKGQKSFLKGNSYESLKRAWLEELSDASVRNPENLLQIPSLHIVLIQWEREAGELKPITKWFSSLPFDYRNFFVFLRVFRKGTSQGDRIDLKEMFHFFGNAVRSMDSYETRNTENEYEKKLMDIYGVSLDETAHGSLELQE